MKFGAFKVDDVTESAADAGKEKAIVEETRMDASAAVVDGSGSGTSLITQHDLSHYGMRSAFKSENDLSEHLKSAESIFRLRAALTSKITDVCRTVRARLGAIPILTAYSC